MTMTGAISIRRVWPAEFPAFRAHLKRLDPDSRQMRFGGVVSDRFIDDYVDSAHRLGTVVYGAFAGPTLVAAGELRTIFDAWPVAAEAAFSVEKARVSRPKGRLLMKGLKSTPDMFLPSSARLFTAVAQVTRYSRPSPGIWL